MEYKDVKFSVTGTINGETESIEYEYKNKKGTVNGGGMSMVMLKFALENNTPVGPVGMCLDRDINDPLAMLSILTSDEVFQEIVKVDLISGTMPEAPELPSEAI